jgi:FdhD protein
MNPEKKESGEGKVTTKHGIIRVDLGKRLFEHIQDEVVTETTIQLFVNNKPSTVFTCSPSKTRELIVGHLLTQGVINSPEEILQLRFEKEKAIIKLLHENGTQTEMEEKAKKPKKFQNLVLNPETVLNAAKMLDSKAAVFKRTGGTHAAALLDSKGEVLAFSEDIGRHNAVDKVIGEASLKRISLEQTILASTGRLSSEIVCKAANVGIPVVVSLASSTDKGIEVAEKRGLILIGFVRGERFNVYSHPERIKKSFGPES